MKNQDFIKDRSISYSDLSGGLVERLAGPVLMALAIVGAGFLVSGSMSKASQEVQAQAVQAPAAAAKSGEGAGNQGFVIKSARYKILGSEQVVVDESRR